MHRVRNLDEDSQKSFWIDFNEKIKLILGDGIDNTKFFGGFDTRLTSAELQTAFNTQAALYKQNNKKSLGRRSSNNSKIVSKNKSASKSSASNSSLNKIYMQNHNPIPNKIIVPIGIRGSPPISYSEYLSKMGGNNKTKRHKKTRSRKTYRRK
jgi:hypothetical protein